VQLKGAVGTAEPPQRIPHHLLPPSTPSTSIPSPSSVFTPFALLPTPSVLALLARTIALWSWIVFRFPECACRTRSGVLEYLRSTEGKKVCQCYNDVQCQCVMIPDIVLWLGTSQKRIRTCYDIICGNIVSQLQYRTVLYRTRSPRAEAGRNLLGGTRRHLEEHLQGLPSSPSPPPSSSSSPLPPPLLPPLFPSPSSSLSIAPLAADREAPPNPPHPPAHCHPPLRPLPAPLPLPWSLWLLGDEESAGRLTPTAPAPPPGPNLSPNKRAHSAGCLWNRSRRCSLT